MLPIRDNIPTREFPLITVAIIAINVAAWLFYQLPNLEQSVFESGFFPCEVDNSCRAPGRSWEVDALTSMFMHGSWIHIAGNMLFLWIFGNNVEDAMGRIQFLVFYLLAGFAATALQTFITLQFGSPGDSTIPTVGASGAVAGVLGAYLLLHPFARVVTIVFLFFILPIEVPALFFLGGWFLFQLWQGGFGLMAADDPATGGVAFFAHIGGFVFGLLTVYLFTGGPPRRRRTPPWPRMER